MGFVVNNTTSFNLLDLVCPHTCRGCGDLGTVLCERCKKYMIDERKPFCPICKKVVAESPEKIRNIKQKSKLTCGDCEMPFVGLWAFGWRKGALEKLVEEYKYQSVRAMRSVLVELLDIAIPKSFGAEENVTIVPLPTIGKHIRERGLDHTLSLAKGLAKCRGWQCEQILGRAANTVQVGAKVVERQTQAKRAYEIIKNPHSETHYLLLDDVWTTGSTMLAAAQVMQDAGVQKLSAVVVAVSEDKTRITDSAE